LFVTQNLGICNTQLPYDWNGTILANGGNGIATYTTPSLVTGCDSTTTLNLTINYPVTDTQYLDICQSQLPYDWNGHILAAGGTAIASYMTQSLVTGCDSTTILDMSVTPTGDFYLYLNMDPTDPYQDAPVVFTVTSDSADMGSYSIYSWQPASWFYDQTALTQKIPAASGGTVTVVGKSKNGCVDSASITLSITPLQYGIFVPNAFTPNGDGRNDYFEIIPLVTNAYTIELFNVYNRWGQLVYSASGNSSRWDGNNNSNAKADVDTYNYLIEVRFDDGHQEVLKGTVELIR
jgi:gliding motility-associated-like protein